MNPLRKLVRFISSWSLAPLIARGALLLCAVVVLAHIGKGALGHLDEVAVAPVYASIRQSADPHQPRAAPPSPPPHASHGSQQHNAAHGSGNTDPSQPCSAHEGPGCSGTRAPGVTADGRVILNTATVADLVRLPGVGKSRAKAILALRNKLGRFRRVRDLLRVRGIGFKSLRKLKPLVVLDPPQEPDAQPGKK